MTTVSYSEARPFRANENVDLLIGLALNLTNPNAPDIAELNDHAKFRDIVGVAPFSDIEWPANTASDKSDEGPVINQSASIEKPGLSKYQGDKIGDYLAVALNESTSTQGWLNKLIDSIQYDKQGIRIFAVTRIAQSPATDRSAIAAGDLVSVYRFLAVATHNTSSTGASYRREIHLIADGLSVPYTFAIDAKNKVSPVITPSAPSLTSGAFTQFRATAYGRDVTGLVDWSVDDASVLAMDPTGLTRGGNAGTTKLHASHPALNTSDMSVTVAAASAPTITDTDPYAITTKGGVIAVKGTDLDSVSAVVLDGDSLISWSLSGTEGKVYIPAALSVGTHALTFVPVSGTAIAKSVAVTSGN